MNQILTSLEWNILQSIIALMIMLLLRYIIAGLITRRQLIANFELTRKRITIKLLNIMFIVILAFSFAGIWGLEGGKIFTWITSVLTVMGVAFFAQWSLLSNITSGLILFFNHPLKIGDYVEIIDKDFPMEGRVENITLFFLHLRNKDDQVYTLSNTIVVQKTMRILKPEEFYQHQREHLKRKDVTEENTM